MISVAKNKGVQCTLPKTSEKPKAKSKANCKGIFWRFGSSLSGMTRTLTNKKVSKNKKMRFVEQLSNNSEALSCCNGECDEGTRSKYLRCLTTKPSPSTSPNNINRSYGTRVRFDTDSYEVKV